MSNSTMSVEQLHKRVKVLEWLKVSARGEPNTLREIEQELSEIECIDLPMAINLEVQMQIEEAENQ